MLSPRDLVIYEDAALKDAMEKINRVMGKQLVVLNKKNKAIGMIGDGDVRRALLRGALLAGPATDHMKTSFISVEEKDVSKLREIFEEHLVSTIPVISHAGILQKIATVSAPDCKLRMFDFK